MTKKQIPLTVEVFQKVLMPQTSPYKGTILCPRRQDNGRTQKTS